jgi:hypothetical protein
MAAEWMSLRSHGEAGDHLLTLKVSRPLAPKEPRARLLVSEPLCGHIRTTRAGDETPRYRRPLCRHPVYFAGKR